MSIGQFIVLQGVMFVGAYIQTSTGFAFGLLVMAGIASFDIMSIQDAGILIMFLSFFNISIALKGRSVSVKKLKCMPFFVISPFAVMLGLYILYLLTNSPLGYQILYGVLGVFTLFAAISLIVTPHPLKKRLHIGYFYFTALCTGVLTGLFTAGVPPMMYLLYRQPWCLSMIRYILFMSSMVLIPSRILFLLVTEGFEQSIVLWTLLSVPAVYVATVLAKKYIQRTRTELLRKLAFIMLLLSGVNILVKTALM